MTVVVHLIAHAATAELRAGTFPADEPLDARGLADAARAAQHPRWPSAAHAFTSPALRARQTAEALGLAADDAPALADLDAGSWRGRKLAAIAQDTPDALGAWIADARAAPHGGESFAQVLQRVGAWLDALPDPAEIVAVTHAAVLRAAIAHALGAAPDAMLRLDIAPLAHIEMTRTAASPRGGWVLRLDAGLPGA